MDFSTMKTELFTESQLAAAAERSREYVRQARALGLISPIGATATGIHVYDLSAIQQLRLITRPILVSTRPAVVGTSESAIRVWRAYSAVLPTSA